MAIKGSLKIFRPVKVNELKRLGNKYDGGYVVDRASLHDADYLVNYGVGYNTAFEEDFFQETGLPTLAFDPTMIGWKPIIEKFKTFHLNTILRQLKNSVFWSFKAKKLKDFKIKFIETGLSEKDSKDYKTLAFHYKNYDLFDKKIILKIDIEGAEYSIFNDPITYDLIPNAIQILLEVHYVEQNIENLMEIISRISTTHTVIHIHANNHSGTFRYNNKDVPRTMEITFILNEYVKQGDYVDWEYPILGLDSPCYRLAEDIKLDFFYD